jgi:hypothetical protein
MRKSAQCLRVGDKLVNPQTGQHTSTVVEAKIEDFDIGREATQERVLLTVERVDGIEITRDVSPEYSFEVLDEKLEEMEGMS